MPAVHAGAVANHEGRVATRGTTTQQRARVLRRLLARAYDPGKGADPENIADMLTDLRHLCDVQGLDFGECDRIAYQNYLSEMATQSMDVD